MCAVDETEHSFFPAHLDESLIRHAKARKTDDSVQYGKLDSPSACSVLPLNRLSKGVYDCVIAQRKLKLNLDVFSRRRLADVVDRLLARRIGNVKVDDLLSFLVRQTSENRIDTCRSVGHKDNLIRGDFEKCCNCLARAVKSSGVGIADEWVRPFLAQILESLEGFQHDGGNGTKGT